MQFAFERHEDGRETVSVDGREMMSIRNEPGDSAMMGRVWEWVHDRPAGLTTCLAWDAIDAASVAGFWFGEEKVDRVEVTLPAAALALSTTRQVSMGYAR